MIKTEEFRERYNLAIGRIKEIINECESEDTLLFKEYFKNVSEFVITVDGVMSKITDKSYFDMPLNELKRINDMLYEDIKGDNYSRSYANPDYAYDCFVKQFDEKNADAYAKMFSALYAQVRQIIAYAYEHKLMDIITTLELFIQIYGTVQGWEETDEGELKNAIKQDMYYFIYDYADEYNDDSVNDSLKTDSPAYEIVMNSDLSDERYLYFYGECIGENEIGSSKYLAKLDEDKIHALAKTYVDGYIEGFNYAGIDLSKKETVNIRYNVGFERVVKESIKLFENQGLKPVMYMNTAGIRKASVRKIGIQSLGANNQYDYDHRYDFAYFCNKSLLDRYLACTRSAYEKVEKEAGLYAGPAVMEVFGEKPFVPAASKHAVSPDKKTMKLITSYNQERNLLLDEFINLSTTSFTIIAYPVPEIGENFEEIFDETVKINTLDKDMYRSIQESIISVLDKGKCVHIYGMNGNVTDLTVNLIKLNDEEKETKFENCLADVNIPVGEVFTSPVLKGTNGILNAGRVYLNGLEYNNLKVYFKDGMIDDYSCDNFDDEEKGKKYFEENVMYGHETLPMGEFAIGTNTFAYAMAKKYNISDKLPILIAEKTGPHFAVGDTCYSMSEDNKVYNPDGKEIVARDNEVSILRKTDIEKAYYNCHTDITIPYEELGLIEVEDYDGNLTKIIENGRFVLDGTTKLNDALNY